VSFEGLAEIAGELDTVKLTVTFCEVAPAAETVTVPVKEPAVVRPDVSMETLMELELDIVPEGVTDSHEPPEAVVAAAVKGSPKVPPIPTGCGVGVALPI
jgi:hypothetical protein